MLCLCPVKSDVKFLLMEQMLRIDGCIAQIVPAEELYRFPGIDCARLRREEAVNKLVKIFRWWNLPELLEAGANRLTACFVGRNQLVM
jgi:hypothetical protein